MLQFDFVVVAQQTAGMGRIDELEAVLLGAWRSIYDGQASFGCGAFCGRSVLQIIRELGVALGNSG